MPVFLLRIIRDFSNPRYQDSIRDFNLCKFLTGKRCGKRKREGEMERPIVNFLMITKCQIDRLLPTLLAF